MIWAANSDHQTRKLHDQELTHAVIELFLGRCMACCTVLLKPHVIHIHILQFRHKKLDYPVAIANTINCYCLTSRIFKEEWFDASSPKSALNSEMRLFLNYHSWVF